MTNPTQILLKPSSVEQTTPCASILRDHKNFMLIFLNSWQALSKNTLHLLSPDTDPEHLCLIHVYLMGMN